MKNNCFKVFPSLLYVFIILNDNDLLSCEVIGGEQLYSKMFQIKRFIISDTNK